jgi:murein DD-endopeptidase MepM/ murein hydrolase activator NlpD
MLEEVKILRLAKYHIIALIVMPILLLGVFLFTVSTLYAEEDTLAEDVETSENEELVAELNKQIGDQHKKIDELAERISEHKQSIKKFQGQAASLRSQVYILDNQMAKTELDIEAKEEEVTVTELEIERVELEMVDGEESIEKQKDYLSAFIRLLDYYDDKDYLSVLLNNGSFSEFFDQVNNIEGIEEDLQKSLNRFQEMLEKLEDQKEELNDKRDKLSELLSKLEDERISLSAQVGTKQYLIRETSNSESRYQVLISNLKQEQLSANNAIAGMERQLRQELEKRGEEEKFNSFGEPALIWPTVSRRITSTYHDPDYPYRHLFEHSGLDVGIPTGTPIKAAEAGYVARVSIGTKWYGNYIMIIHNNNLATLYAHLNTVNVSTDQYVGRGQVIGGSGSTGFSSGPHLHFEVRSNGIPVNPLNYIR